MDISVGPSKRYEYVWEDDDPKDETPKDEGETYNIYTRSRFGRWLFAKGEYKHVASAEAAMVRMYTRGELLSKAVVSKCRPESGTIPDIEGDKG